MAISYERGEPRTAVHAALTSKVLAGTLAVAALAALRVDESSGTSGRSALPVRTQGIDVAAVGRFPIAALPPWVQDWRARPPMQLVSDQRATPGHRGARLSPSARRRAAQGRATSQDHAVSASRTASRDHVVRPAIRGAAGAPAGQGDGHGAPTTPRHPGLPTSTSSSWSSHWTTAPDGKVVKTTTTTHITTIGGKSNRTTHTNTKVSPARPPAATPKPVRSSAPVRSTPTPSPSSGPVKTTSPSATGGNSSPHSGGQGT